MYVTYSRISHKINDEIVLEKLRERQISRIDLNTTNLGHIGLNLIFNQVEFH